MGRDLWPLKSFSDFRDIIEGDLISIKDLFIHFKERLNQLGEKQIACYLLNSLEIPFTTTLSLDLPILSYILTLIGLRQLQTGKFENIFEMDLQSMLNLLRRTLSSFVRNLEVDQEDVLKDFEIWLISEIDGETIREKDHPCTLR